MDMIPIPEDKITCACGSIISNRPEAIYSHEHGVKHKRFAGLLTDEQYHDYREKQKELYHSDESAEKTRKHREKMHERMRERNTENFLKSREQTIHCDACGYNINATAKYMHNKSKKHLFALKGLPVPYQSRKKPEGVAIL